MGSEQFLMPVDAAVTVVVPTRNRVGLLPTTLATILAQRHAPASVVVVDEGSTDDTRAWLASVDDPRLVVVDGPCRGVGAARNRGLAEVVTPWVAFCDDDDLWAPGKLAAQLALLDATGTGWSCTGSVAVSGPGLDVVDHQRARGGEVAHALLAQNLVPGGGSAVVASAELVRSVGAFDEEIPASEDWELWIRLAHRSPLAAVDAPLVGYRVTPGSMSADVERMIASRRIVFERHGGLGSAATDATYAAYLSKQQVRSGDRRAAIRYLELAVRHRRLAQLPRSAVALVSPSLVDRIGTGRARRRVPAGWRTEADAWLAPYRPAADSRAPYRAAASSSSSSARAAADRP